MVRRGFTLIEMLIVVVVLAILVGILLPTLIRQKNTAKIRQAVSEIRTVKSAILAYHLEYGDWPVPPSDLVDPVKDKDYTDGSGGNGASGDIVKRLRNPPDGVPAGKPPLLDASHLKLDGADNILDPWQSNYVIRVDLDNDGYFQGNTTNVVYDSVMVSNAPNDQTQGFEY